MESPAEDAYLPVGAAGFAGASAYAATRTNGDRAWGLTDGYAVFDQNIYGELAARLQQRPRSGYQGTRGQLLMHELGHTVGLGHADQTKQIMYPSMSQKKATWCAGDMTGLSRVGMTRGCLEAVTAARTRVQTITAGLQ